MTNQMICSDIFNETMNVLSAFSSSGFLAFVKQRFVRPGEANSSKIIVEQVWPGERKTVYETDYIISINHKLNAGSNCN